VERGASCFWREVRERTESTAGTIATPEQGSPAQAGLPLIRIKTLAALLQH
jgi:hypothetical protein